MSAPWSWARFQDFLGHIWLPVIILAIGGTANLIRTMRATMLDELRKQYVTVARAKGLSEFKVLLNYPVRIAINPIVSTFGWLLVWFFSGGTVVEIVLNLDTAGPVLWRALMTQDMYTAGAYIVIVGALTAIGSLVSDLMLAAIDPRVRFGGNGGIMSENDDSHQDKQLAKPARKPPPRTKLFIRAGQWQLVWWKFRRHKLAQFAMVVLAVFYIIAMFAEVVAPFDPLHRMKEFASMSPARVYLFDWKGKFHCPSSMVWSGPVIQ